MSLCASVQTNHASDRQEFSLEAENRWAAGLDAGDPVDGENASESRAYNSLTSLGLGGARRKKKPVLILAADEAQSAYQQLAVTAAHDFDSSIKTTRVASLAPLAAVPTPQPDQSLGDQDQDDGFRPEYFSGDGADDALARWLPASFGQEAEPAPPPPASLTATDEEAGVPSQVQAQVQAFDPIDDEPEDEAAEDGPVDYDAAAQAALDRWLPKEFGGSEDLPEADAEPEIDFAWQEAPAPDAEVAPEPEPVADEQPEIMADREMRDDADVEPEWRAPVEHDDLQAADADNGQRDTDDAFALGPEHVVIEPEAAPKAVPEGLFAAMSEDTWEQREAIPGVALFPKREASHDVRALRARLSRTEVRRVSLLDRIVAWLKGLLG